MHRSFERRHDVTVPAIASLRRPREQAFDRSNRRHFHRGLRGHRARTSHQGQQGGFSAAWGRIALDRVCRRRRRSRGDRTSAQRVGRFHGADRILPDRRHDNSRSHRRP